MRRKERKSKVASEKALAKLYPLREETGKALSLKYPLKTSKHNYDLKF